MKRVLLALLGILIVAGFCMAQAGDFRQQGMASQVMLTDGMTAAHPSLPIGSRAWVINTVTNDEIEVTITGRIPPALDRIIDLSPAAARELGLDEGGHVIVTTTSPPLPLPVPPPLAVVIEPEPEPVPVVVVAPEPEPEPVIAVEPEPEPVVVIAEPELEPVQPPQQPITITIHNYIVVPDEPPPPVERRERPIRQYRGPRTMSAYVPTEDEVLPQVQPPVNLEPPINGVVVIPGLPDPHGNRVYRLQLGAYSGTGSALLTTRLVESAGFTAVQEQYGNLLRVFVDGVPSGNVQFAVQRLAAMGFTQIWVRE